MVGVQTTGGVTARRRQTPSAGRGTVRIDVLLTDDERLALLRAEARRGLTASPKQLPPKWFYDERGSALFEDITRQPEYYLTRREREILLTRAGEIAHVTLATTLVELGSGSSEKTRLLIDALRAEESLRRFMPFDVCLPFVRDAAGALAHDYPGMGVHAIVGDFHKHLRFLPRDAITGTVMLAFLGSTLGNFDDTERARFFRSLAVVLRPGDWFLLGADLIKAKRRLDAAYNDAAGVTVQFNKNVLRVLDRDLDATFDEDLFEHVARYDVKRQLVDIRLRARVAHKVKVGALGLTVPFAAREEMRTEISVKFTRKGLETELAAAGLKQSRWWTDPGRDFSLSLWRRT
jgi:L-histidine Nalpha-methyltransferase